MVDIFSIVARYDLVMSYVMIFSDVSITYKLVFGSTGALTLFVVLIYIETVYFLHKHDKQRKKFPGEKAKWILAIYPVSLKNLNN